jgi:hypothetical protein
MKSLQDVVYVFSGLGTVLAGFSFSMITRDFRIAHRPRLSTFTLSCFVIAAALMITVTCMSTSILISLATANQAKLEWYVSKPAIVD